MNHFKLMRNIILLVLGTHSSNLLFTNFSFASVGQNNWQT